jgi:ribosome-associated protein
LEPLSALKDRKKSSTQLTRSSKIFKTIIAAIQDKKGENIISLDLKKIHEAAADFFIICEASNTTQLKAITDHIEYEVKHNCGEIPYKSCGACDAS